MIFIVVATTSVIVALIMAFQVPASIARPLKQLTDIANRISKGEVDQHIKISGSHEIVTLAKSIERLQVATLGLLRRLQSSRNADKNNSTG